MTFAGWAEIALYVAVLTAIVPLLGAYMARVFTRPVTSVRLLGPAATAEQDWKAYARSALVFSAVSWGALYLILRTQRLHPFNPAGLRSPSWDLSFNTASSFVTNTNWQYYGGETTMTYFSQMAGLVVQNYVSAAVAIAVVIALVRGLASRSGRSLGNFYADVWRALVYVLVPLSLVGAVVLLLCGIPQTLGGAVDASGVAGAAKQTIARGPVALQEAIKLLGTNGGGFFNVNSSHPYENPSWVANFIEMVMILMIPGALTATYGRMVGNRRQGWAIYGAMMALFLVAVAVLYGAETHGTPAMHAAGIVGPNLEGKEARFGIPSSALFATITTAASCGAVNAAMESLTGLGGAVPMAQMMMGEVVFGGVGSGLYGMLLLAIIAVFIAGLMVGRTPEFLGKKIESREVKLAILGSIGVPLLVLVATAIAIATTYGKVSIFDSGPQGFSETLYAYTSQANNNGSAFAGYTGYLQPDGTNVGAFGISFADVLGGFVMLIGRFLPMLLVLAVAGSLATKRVHPPGLGTLRTDTPTFVSVLVGVVVLIALLTFVPALLLGPAAQSLTDRLF